MEKYNPDIRRHLKWEQNKAATIQSIINQKADWIDNYNTRFWSDWEKNVLEIDTANQFGLAVWCIILGVSSDLFDFNPATLAFAFGQHRENFVYDSTYPHTGLPDKKSTGGNFLSDDNALTNLDDIRQLLKFRYAALVSNGRIFYMNRMLNWILNKGEKWDVPNKKYAYAIDSESKGVDLSASIYVDDWQGFRNIKIGPNTARQMYLLWNDTLTANLMAESKTILSGLNIFSNLIVAANGSLTADQIGPTGGVPVEHSITFDTSGAKLYDSSTSGNMIFSIFLKPAGYSAVSISMYNQKTSGPDEIGNSITADANTGECSGNAYFDDRIYPNGWRRLIVPFSYSAGYTKTLIKMNMLDSNGLSVFSGTADKSLRLSLWYWMCETSDSFNDAVQVGGAASASTPPLIPANTIDNTTGVVTFGRAVGNGANIYWKGCWGIGSYQTPYNFANGNGTLKSFTIQKPKNDGALITKQNYIEFRIGAGNPISPKLVDMMNNRDNGLVFQNAGVSYLVVQES